MASSKNSSVTSHEKIALVISGIVILAVVLLFGSFLFTMFHEAPYELSRDKSTVASVEIAKVNDAYGDVTEEILLRADSSLIDELETLECSPIHPPESASSGKAVKVSYNNGDVEYIFWISSVTRRSDGKIRERNVSFDKDEFSALIDKYLEKETVSE